MTSNAAQCSRIVGRRSGFTLAKEYGSRTRKSLAVFVVAACVAIHGQSSPKQMADPAVAALGGGFVSDTAQVNGTTLHYVLGGAGAAIILLHGFPEDWYAYHRTQAILSQWNARRQIRMRFKMIGYGKFQYVARNGQYVDWPAVGVALQKNYISVYLSVIKDGASLIQLYSRKLGQLKLGRNHFSFRTYEDLDVRLLASLFAEAEQIFQSDSRRCNLAQGGTQAIRTR